MTELGTLLAKARLNQGLTIEEMSERTKIRPNYLEAIEAEEFHLLPGEAYVKPFLRTYAKALGLEDQIASSLQSEASVSEDAISAVSIRERRERTRKIRRRRFIIRLSFLLIMLGGALYLMYMLLNRR